MTPVAVFTVLHFLHNLRIGSIRQSVTSQKAGKAFQEQTLLLTEPIRKLHKNEVLWI